MKKELDTKEGEIIKIGDGPFTPKAKVLRIYSEKEKKFSLCGDIQVIYNQNGL